MELLKKNKDYFKNMRKLKLVRKYDSSKENFIKNFRLKRARIAKKFTERDLARKAGITEQNYYTIEGLVSYPSSKTKQDIANVLNQDPEYLFPERFREYSFDKYRESHSQDVLDNLNRVEFDFEQIEDPVNYEGVIDKILDSASLNNKIMELLKTLKYREAELIKDRFGFRANYSLREAAKKYKVSPERIRQIEAKAIRKLQHPVRMKELIGFYRDLIY